MSRTSVISAQRRRCTSASQNSFCPGCSSHMWSTWASFRQETLIWADKVWPRRLTRKTTNLKSITMITFSIGAALHQRKQPERTLSGSKLAKYVREQFGQNHLQRPLTKNSLDQNCHSCIWSIIVPTEVIQVGTWKSKKAKIRRLLLCGGIQWPHLPVP